MTLSQWINLLSPFLDDYEQGHDHNHFRGGTIVNNAATGAISIKNQVSLVIGKTMLAKTSFEEWL